VAPGRAMVGDGARRSVPTPLVRGTVVAAIVTGGAFSLVGAAPPTPASEPDSAPLEAPGMAVAQAVQTMPVETDPVLLRSAVEPIAPEPEVTDAAELVKAAQLVEQELARVEAEQAAAEERTAQEKATQEKAAQDKVQETVDAASGILDCGLSTVGLGAVKPHVRAAAAALGCLFGQPRMIGVASRAGTSDHPSGKALDFMVNRSTGDALAACALRNKEALGIDYVIWRQRINYGNGWESMEDRGGTTANHYDHVHLSFASSGGGGTPRGC